MEVTAGSLNQTLVQLKKNHRLRQTAVTSIAFIPHTEVIPVDLGTLPYDILQHVFGYIDNDYLVKYVSLVCKAWRRAIMHEKFVKHLSIANNEVPLYYIYDFLREYKSLYSLNLTNVPEPLHILIQACKVCNNLKKISLQHYQHIDGKVLSYITKAFPKLEALSLDSSNIDTIALSSEITLLADLKSLNLFNVKSISLNTSTILEIVLNCRELEELNIGLCPPLVHLKDDDVVVIVTNLASKLTSITLDSRLLTMHSYEKLKECKKLRRLYIKYAVNLTGDFLLEFWKNLWDVKELGFTHNCIVNGYDISNLFLNGAQVFTSITHLDFTYCVLLSDIGIESIAQVCSQLTKIFLKSCRSITSIQPVCIHCKDLKVIDISYCLQLKMTFTLPKYLEILIVDERKSMLYYVEKFKRLKFLRIYISLCEFNDTLERI